VQKEATVETKKMGATQRTMIEALERLYNEANRQCTLGDTQGTRKSVLVSDWIAACRKADPAMHTDKKGSFRRDNFMRAAKSLEARGLLIFLKDKNFVFLNEGKDLDYV
jgi:hypothetical protein